MNDFRKLIGLAFGAIFVAMMAVMLAQLATKPRMSDSVRMVAR